MRHGYGLLCIASSLVLVVSVKIIRVDGGYRHTGDAADSHFQQRKEAVTRFNRRHNNVILAPLEGRSVITKERMYVNAMEERDDQVYQKLLVDPKASVDSFFVTEPPLRTRMPERLELTTFTSPLDQEATFLKLVTLPKLTTTSPPPFKYFAATTPPSSREQPNPDLGLQLLSQFDPSHSQAVRFPAQPWQIPPREPQKLFNPWEQLFEPPKLFPSLQPSNPFLINPSQPLQNVSNSFIPIGISNPAPFSSFSNNYPPAQPLQPPPAPFEHSMVHKSALRSSGSAKMAHISPIALPSDPVSIGYDRHKESPIPSDFSVHALPNIYNKDESYKNHAKTFVSSSFRSWAIEGGSEQLKTFAMHHPNIINHGRKVPAIKESQLVLPKSLQSSSLGRPIVPLTPVAPPTVGSSGLSPNQKLYLCCQKQQVSLACQGICNFDTFNDKSLVSTFLTNQCPGPQLGKAYDCASSKADHSTCCERNGLLNFQGGRCMAFCRTHVATPPNILDYFPCLQVFDTIKYCYREYQLDNNSIFGD